MKSSQNLRSNGSSEYLLSVPLALSNVEPDVLLSGALAILALVTKVVAPQTAMWSKIVELLSWTCFTLSVAASWSIAKRFISTLGETEQSLDLNKSIWLVLAPSVLGPPLISSPILFFTLASYTRQMALYQLLSASLPSCALAYLSSRSQKSMQDIEAQPLSPPSPSPSPDLPQSFKFFSLSLGALRQQPQQAEVLPLRVAILTGKRSPRSKRPRLHPNLRKQMGYSSSSLRYANTSDDDSEDDEASDSSAQ